MRGRLTNILTGRVATVASVLTVVATTTWAATPTVPHGEPGPDLTGYAHSVHVPFAKPVARAGTRAADPASRPAVDFDHLTGMSVRVSVNGGRPLRMLVDTGSVGVILGVSDVPDVDPHAPPGQMVYSSSGYELDGVWTPTTITFLDAAGPDGKPVTAQVPVLAVSQGVTHPGAVNGPKTAATGPIVNHNPHPYMFGVGFGRGKDPHPERNPFLNLSAMRAGTMRRGYAITRDGFTLGLTAADAGPGYRWQHLVERDVSAEAKQLSPGLKDWETSRGWIVVDGKREPEVPILIDTGLTNFMIPTPGLSANTEMPRGTDIEVDLLGGQLHYRFKSAEAKDPRSSDPTVPLKVTRFPTTNPAANVNTGLRTLAIYDYLFDADGGYLGLRPTAAHP